MRPETKAVRDRATGAVGDRKNMLPTDVLVKTDKGIEEVKTRKYRLPARSRILLFMIDGRHAIGEILDQTAKLGLPATALKELLDGDFVTNVSASTIRAATPVAGAGGSAASYASDGERYIRAQKFMNDTVVDALGIKAFFFTLKLERCANIADLQALVDDYTKALEKGMGGDMAQLAIRRVRDLLRLLPPR
jgi:hypothetical protein